MTTFPDEIGYYWFIGSVTIPHARGNETVEYTKPVIIEVTKGYFNNRLIALFYQLDGYFYQDELSGKYEPVVPPTIEVEYAV